VTKVYMIKPIVIYFLGYSYVFSIWWNLFSFFW
jgi:hypothetical protein